MYEYPDFEPSARFKETLSLSADGSQVAYVDDVTGQFNIAVQALAGGEPQRLTRYVDSTVSWVCWHPDGKSLIFLAYPKGNEQAQLYRVGLDGDEPQKLTDLPSVRFAAPAGHAFSPDGGRLLYTGNDRVATERDVLIRELATGDVRRSRVEGATGGLSAGYWSPDGRRVTVADLRGGRSDHVVYLVPADGAPPVRLTADQRGATYWLGPWLSDGSGFLVRSNAGRDFTGLAMLDAASGALSWWDTPDWDVEDVVMSADGRIAIWSVNVDGTSQLRGRDLVSGAELSLPTLPLGTIATMALSREGGTLVMLLSTPTQPSSLAVVDLTTGTLRWLAAAAPVGPVAAGFIEPTLVRYPAREGRNVPAYLYRPPASGPVPVVLAIHGGPGIQERPNYSNDGLFQYLVSRGVAVLAPNAGGSTGYGQAYQRRSFRDWGGADLDDFADAAHFLRGQHWVDPTRIGLIGRSYGGFAVLSCLARLPEFDWAAAVEWSGPSNLVTLARSSPPTWRSKVATLIGDPDSDAELLLSRSPVTYADKIRAPLFVIQGANDPTVPRHESDQIVQRLRERGLDVRYDVYPDEGHAFGRRENQTKARSEAAEFLLAHLKGA